MERYFANRVSSRSSSSRNVVKLRLSKDALLIVANLKLLVIKKPRGDGVPVEDPSSESVHGLTRVSNLPRSSPRMGHTLSADN